MPFGQPISLLPTGDELFLHRDFNPPGLINTGNGWQPCRVSISRWYASPGEWKAFGGYNTGAPSYHKDVCNHRPYSPRSLHQEELNFSDLKHLLMHDPVVLRTSKRKLRTIMDDMTLKNYHLVLRRDGDSMWVSYVIEEPDYNPRIRDETFASARRDKARRIEAASRPSLQPCEDCAAEAEASMLVHDLSQVHGDYTGFTMPLIAPSTKGSMLQRMEIAGQRWLKLRCGPFDLAIPFELVRSLRGFRFNGLKVSPSV